MLMRCIFIGNVRQITVAMPLNVTSPIWRSKRFSFFRGCGGFQARFPPKCFNKEIIFSHYSLLKKFVLLLKSLKRLNSHWTFADSTNFSSKVYEDKVERIFFSICFCSTKAYARSLIRVPLCLCRCLCRTHFFILSFVVACSVGLCR